MRSITVNRYYVHLDQVNSQPLDSTWSRPKVVSKIVRYAAGTPDTPSVDAEEEKGNKFQFPTDEEDHVNRSYNFCSQNVDDEELFDIDEEEDVKELSKEEEAFYDQGLNVSAMAEEVEEETDAEEVLPEFGHVTMGVGASNDGSDDYISDETDQMEDSYQYTDTSAPRTGCR